MTQEFTIRAATAQDLPGLLRLYGQLHPGVPAPALEDAARIIADFFRYRGSAIFIGYLANEPVSTCALIVVPNLTRGGTPYALIENVVTDTAHRGRGYARQVLLHAIAAAWRHDCYKVMLMTGSKDPATLRFYAQAGFEQSKTGFQIRRVPARALEAVGNADAN
ncbi:GNAT family N-acetyltransferase [Methylovirgula sp. 4M-Z18]|uniref:GNAT family N-acetyltransferase n=1 Tax=Methylovirgula sp. 4M-Z18 TaxID=2293567 RepID=UPI000E2F2636|nr:GNAT family N-acetyltransferase [Methylovirgula sp. 4M-Z18]RFB78219.1 GNAT family N-acetyltransferase [Methylovirgula sp. 4M-Z18]